MSRQNWLVADLDGLRKTLARRGKGLIVGELLRNALDENVTTVTIRLAPVPGQPHAVLIVEDDSPEGFRDLADSYTLFADSYKKAHAEKAGRFNIGEKFVLAFCEEARIESTTGTVIFDAKGRRAGRLRRERGTCFRATLRLTRADVEEVSTYVRTLLIPPGVRVTFNDEILPSREPFCLFEVTLPTEVADEEGVLRRAERKTGVRLHEPRDGETATLYELGIPVVPLPDDRFHVDVQQKVPLNLERDNVPPAYLRRVRAAVLNETAGLLSEDDSKALWVREAAGAPEADALAVECVMNLRFGEKRVIYDPSDPEANNIAVARGYTVVTGGSLTPEEWTNVKTHGAIFPAGQVTPSPKPYSPDGDPLKLLPYEKWTPGIKRFEAFAKRVGSAATGREPIVVVCVDPQWPFAATYGPSGQLVVNVGRLGYTWFEAPSSKWVELLVHEFAHHFAGNHLSEEYHSALCRVAASVVRLALDHPKVFRGA